MKISIVTATFNSGGTVRDTLESVLGQTFCDYEHLIIDGGSSDDTLDIVREYEPRYNGRLRWISERDRGIYDAMNKGIAMATGDVVGILNSDDFYTSTSVLTQVADAMQDATVQLDSDGGKCGSGGCRHTRRFIAAGWYMNVTEHSIYHLRSEPTLRTYCDLYMSTASTPVICRWTL